MCLPTKQLTTVQPDQIKTGQFTVKGLMDNGETVKSVSDVYVHELGHIIHMGIRNKKIIDLIDGEYIAYLKKFGVVVYKSGPSFKKVTSKDYISQYAFSDELEFFAECFVVYVMGKGADRKAHV